MRMNFDKNLLYIVACSAGPDSMALLDMLVKEKYNLVVCHVNYKTRKESDHEQDIITRYCAKYNIPLYVKIFDSKEKGSFEDIARKFRYRFFKEIYDKVDASGVFIAHHKDDQIETYLLKKERNVINESYLIKEKTTINNMTIYRPLLEKYYKDDLLKYCDDNNLEYGIDITNFQDIHPRNRIRKKLATMDKEKVYSEAILADRNLQIKRKEVKEFLKYYPVYTIELLKDKDDIFLLMFLHELCDKKYKKYINKSFCISLKEFISSKKPAIQRLVSNNYYLVKKYNVIQFEYQQDAEPFEYKLDKIEHISNEHFRIVDSGLKMQGIYLEDADFPIIIRSYRMDDTIKLKEGNKKINRLFIDKKIPKDERITYPIIENANHEIIFVYGLYRKYGYKYIKNNLFMIK